MYIHERDDWPGFFWDQTSLATQLAAVRHRQGRLIGRMESLGLALREEAVLRTLTLDVLKSSEIEGEILEIDQVRSSLARRLGLEIGALTPADRNVEGVVELMLDATGNYSEPLTEQRLFSWHCGLFPAGHRRMQKLRVGQWRDDHSGPMQVVSGPIGREKIHYQAPAASKIPDQMARLLDWFNGPVLIDPVLKAGLAHFWFVTIHPFDDGNGRIARAIADMALARSEQSPQRFYSMSAQIRLERNAYYAVLEQSQRASMDITAWLQWFLACLDRAIDGAQATLGSVLRKASFWESHAAEPLNDRQKKVLNRLLDGFEGKLTSTKWARLAGCSQDTASRDINDLLHRGILTKNPAGGRSTSYDLSD